MNRNYLRMQHWAVLAKDYNGIKAYYSNNKQENIFNMMENKKQIASFI